MLSIEGPSGPSCSCQVPALKSDERSLDSQAKDPSGLSLNQSPQFSIRDYVSTTRKKDIGTNWPFPQHHLQLCLKHGISVLLPPFEPPDSVRSHCCLKRKGSDKLLTCIDSARSGVEPDKPAEKASCSFDTESKSLDHENHLISDPLIRESALQCYKEASGKGKQKALCGGICDDADGLKYGEADIESVVTSHAHIEQSDPNQSSKCPQLENKRVLKASVELEVNRPSSFPGKVESAKEPSGKKYKLIVKLGTNPEVGRADEISSNSSMISDSMASKVCPVCKTFASTSNTTLNAHIDQCLSMESNNDQVIGTLFKYKVKPPKKRLMVDIYSNARHCTLEDLDRRNGTSWALDLASIASNREVCTENKRQKISSVDQADGETEKGAVYIDSNGTKICILSKLNALAPSTQRESSNSKPKKFGKELKQRMRFTIGKRRRLAPKQSKHMKVKALMKKVASFGLFKDQIQMGSNIKQVHDAIETEAQPPSEMAPSQNQIGRKGPRALRPLFSSEVSAVSENLNSPLTDNNGEKSSAMCSPTVKFSNSHPIKSSATNCTINLPQPVDSNFTVRIKSMNVLSNSPITGNGKEKQSQSILDNESCHLTGEFSSEGCLRLKPPKSIRKLLSFPRRKKFEKNSSLKGKSGNFPGPPAETSKSFHHTRVEEDVQSKLDKLMEKTLLPSSDVCNNRWNKHRLILKRLQKHRSAKRNCKEVEESCPDSDECLYMNSYGVMSVNEVNYPEVLRTTKTDGIINSHSSEQGTLFESGHKVPVGCTEKDNYGSLERFASEDEYYSPEADNIDMKAEHSVDSAIATKSPFDGIANPPITAEHLASVGLLATSDSSLKSWARLVENDSFIPGREVWADTHDPRLFDHQLMHISNETTNEITGSVNEILGEVEFRAIGDTFPKGQYMEYQTNAQQVLVSSTCQSSSANTGAEIPQGNSSMTSVRMTNDDQNMAIDSKPCESPVSGTSNVSHPSGEELKKQISDRIVGERPVVDETSRRLVFAESWESGSFTKRRFAGECNQEMSRITLGRQHENYRENQPCCCSRRESVCHESHPFSRQYMVPEMTLPVKVRQFSSNVHLSNEMVVPPICSCPRLTSEMAAAEMLELPSDHALQRVHSDTAEICKPRVRVGSSGQTEQPCTPNPVFRLMGKDVLVINKDEEQDHCQNIIPCSSDSPSSSGQYSSILRHSVNSSGLCCNSDSCQHHQFMEGWKYARSVPMHPFGKRNCTTYTGMPLYGNLSTGNLPPTQPNRLGWDTLFSCNMEKAPLPHLHPKPTYLPYRTKEVIAIENSKVEAEPGIGLPTSPASSLSSTVAVPNFRQLRPSSCFHSQYPFLVRGIPGGQRPRFPDMQPAVMGNPSEIQDHLPSPARVPSLSAGHSSRTRPMLFYFQS